MYNGNSGSGSYSYRSAYAYEDNHEPIPITYCERRTVKLYVYDIDSASASGSSLMSGITGVPIKHSSIVVFDIEYEFSQAGVETKKVQEKDEKLSPEEVIHLGCTEKSVTELNRMVTDLRCTKYWSARYNVRSHNCHHFSNELSLFLTGKPIPARFLEMADEVTSAVTKTALMVGGVAAAGILAYNLLPERPRQQAERERQAPQNNNSLLMGLGAVAAGGLAYHLLSSDEKPQREPQRQSWQQRKSQNESGFGGAGLLGALAAGAAGLAAVGVGNNNANEDEPAEWLERMLNLR